MREGAGGPRGINAYGGAPREAVRAVPRGEGGDGDGARPSLARSAATGAPAAKREPPRAATGLLATRCANFAQLGPTCENKLFLALIRHVAVNVVSAGVDGYGAVASTAIADAGDAREDVVVGERDLDVVLAVDDHL